MLVIDASVAVAACHTPMGFARLQRHALVAPPLMVVEASSVLHELAWRNDVSATHADAMLERLIQAPIETRSPPDLSRAAWHVADELGWAKTYDAHYVALAQKLKCRLVSIDERLLRGVARLDIAIRPGDL
jgi:predicted nucleic acid-binding protein